ncbi:MAG TPA: hypothetical protein VKM72_25240 [Thermoanaerobaculia bacterium]|nr:hypothetical protein [Thermoanaerobaculia bacterium]
MMAHEEPRALRLTFSYTGSNVKLVSRQSLTMLAPLSDSLATFAGRSGFWYELRNAKGVAIYRRVQENPIQFTPEAAAADRVSLRRFRVTNPRGIFVLLMPDLAEAQTLALVSSPLGTGDAGPATDIALFNLRPVPIA